MAEEYHNDHMDEEEKFRTPKRHKDKGKQIASETDEDGTITVRVKQIHERPDRLPPIVAYFSTRYDPSAENRETGEKETPKISVYRHKDESKKRIQVVVSPPDANVEFVGTNYSGENAAKVTTSYSLGILNKENKTLTLVPIAGNKVIRMEPRIKEVPEALESVEEQPSIKDKARKTTSLFGSKKDVIRDKKKQALNLQDDLQTQKILDGKLKKLDAKTSALESTSSTVARNIPPYDASATTPREAYPLEKIIDKGELNFLQDIYRLLQQETETGTGAATDAYPVFVRNRLYKVRDIKDDTEKQMVCAALSLLTHLIKFKDMNSMNGFDSAKDHKLPGIIRQKCFSLFKDPDSTRIPIDKTNLLISYVLVLSLHVDHFKSDPTDIAKDLRMGVLDLRSHFTILGCHLKHEKSTSLATLPTPLKFPEISRYKRKR